MKEKWVTVDLGLTDFDIDIDLKILVNEFEQVIEDGILVQPRTVDIDLLAAQMEGEDVPQALLVKLKDNIEDILYGVDL